MAEKLETISFYLPENLAREAWKRAAAERMSLDDFLIKLILGDADELHRLQKKRKSKIIQFPTTRKAKDCT